MKDISACSKRIQKVVYNTRAREPMYPSSQRKNEAWYRIYAEAKPGQPGGTTMMWCDDAMSCQKQNLRRHSSSMTKTPDNDGDETPAKSTKKPRPHFFFFTSSIWPSANSPDDPVFCAYFRFWAFSLPLL